MTAYHGDEWESVFELTSFSTILELPIPSFATYCDARSLGAFSRSSRKCEQFATSIFNDAVWSIYVIEGCCGDGQPERQNCACYNLGSRMWNSLPCLPRQCIVTMLALESQVYVIGRLISDVDRQERLDRGFGGNVSGPPEQSAGVHFLFLRFDARKQIWEDFDSAPVLFDDSQHGHDPWPVALDGCMYFLGNGSTLSDTFGNIQIARYSACDCTWDLLSPLPNYHTCGHLQMLATRGNIYVIGRTKDNGNCSFECFSTAAGRWEVLQPLRGRHALCYDANGPPGQAVASAGHIFLLRDLGNYFDDPHWWSCFDCRTRTWNEGLFATAHSNNVQMVPCGDKFYTLQYGSRAVNRYDCKTQTWQICPNTACFVHGDVVALGNEKQLFAIGGHASISDDESDSDVNASPHDQIERIYNFDSHCSRWDSLDPIPSFLALRPRDDGWFLVSVPVFGHHEA